MLAVVMSSRLAEGTSKKTNKPYKAMVTHVVFDGEVKECEAVWIDPALLEGRVPEYGDVLDLQYNRQGFLQSVKFKDEQEGIFAIRNRQNKAGDNR